MPKKSPSWVSSGLRPHDDRQAEIQDTRIVEVVRSGCLRRFPGDQDVRRLDVAMHGPHLVDIRQGLREFRRDLGRLPRQQPTAREEIVKRGALHVVRDEDGPTLPLEDFVQGHDPRVPQAGDDPRLPGEAGQEVGGGAMSMGDLQGHDPVQLLVDRLPDGAVRSTSQRLQEAIVADAPRPGRQGRWAPGSAMVKFAVLWPLRGVPMPDWPPRGPIDGPPSRPR